MGSTFGQVGHGLSRLGNCLDLPTYGMKVGSSRIASRHLSEGEARGHRPPLPGVPHVREVEPPVAGVLHPGELAGDGRFNPGPVVRLCLEEAHADIAHLTAPEGPPVAGNGHHLSN